MTTIHVSPLGFHEGHALLEVANRYPTLLEVISEGVQNALDASAKTIWVNINIRRGSITISDNGDGTSRDKFEKALLSICRSIKNPDALGQFGMGLIAPLGKCRMFTFTSTPKTNPKGYLQWTFVTEEIEKQEKVRGIPMMPLPNMCYSREKGVPWRTQVKIHDFTRDKSQAARLTLPRIRDFLLERYSQKIRRLETMIHLEITDRTGNTEETKFSAGKFGGRKLPTIQRQSEDCGKVIFDLYIANKSDGQRRGKVSIGRIGNEFRLSFEQFCEYSRGYFIDDEVVAALRSGVFEGEITCEKISLDSSRRFFKEDDSLLDFCVNIIDWYKEEGSKHFLKIREEQQDDRYQRLGLRSMKVLEALVNSNQSLLELIKSARLGTIGTRHANPEAKRMGEQENKSVSVHGGSSGHGSGESSSSEQTRTEPTNEHPGHTPFVVSGPKGTRRTLVRGNSLGLQFVYTEMEGSSKLWEFEAQTGTLRFNTRHPLWAEAERDDITLMKFQEMIAINALAIETIAPHLRESVRQTVDESLTFFVFWLKKGDELSGRKHGSALAQYARGKKKKN